MYKIDIPANRYDMLCLEGIARALNIFNDRMATPSFKLADMKGEAPATRWGPLARLLPSLLKPLASDPPLHSALHGIAELAVCMDTTKCRRTGMQSEIDATCWLPLLTSFWRKASKWLALCGSGGLN